MIVPTTGEASDEGREATTILVHGTYAGADADAGGKWWQSGSETATALDSHVPDEVGVGDAKDVFHWSGENSERARMKAARGLLRRMRSLEEEGKDYHLVGHSHGGSVIWMALQLSMMFRRPLEGLRSWTTVGTPFLQHRSRGAWNLLNWLGLLFGLIMLRPAIRGPLQLIQLFSNIWNGSQGALVLEPDSAVGYVAIFRAPVISLVESIGVAVERREDGIHVGSFDPSSGMSVAEYYFATPEGLFLLGVTMLVSYIFIHVAMLCIKPAVESYRIRLEQRVARLAFERYGKRWLGIWSPDDEAINGLRATLDLTVSFVGKMFPRDRVFLSDLISILSRPYYWVIAPIYNRLLHPALDKTVRSLVLRAAQGNDRPTATLIDVTPAPIPDLRVTALPELLNVRMLTDANRHAHELGPKFRQLLGQPSFTSGLASFHGVLSGRELVHTSYFAQEDVLRLIAANINWHHCGQVTAGDRPPLPIWMARWFSNYKRILEQGPQPADADPVGAPVVVAAGASGLRRRVA